MGLWKKVASLMPLRESKSRRWRIKNLENFELQKKCETVCVCEKDKDP